MAVSVTAADVRPLPGAIIRRFAAGGSLTAGDPVFIASDGDVEQATANAAASARAMGMVVAGSDGATTYASGDMVDVVKYGAVAGFASVEEEKDIFIGGTSYNYVQTAPTAGLVAGSTAYQWIFGHGDAETSIIFVAPRGWAVSTATAS